jgi:hypothetical protein
MIASSRKIGVSTLRHVVLITRSRLGIHTWELLDGDGEPISAFQSYCRLIESHGYNTRKRYVCVVAQFFDYLYESKVFGVSADNVPTVEYVNDVIDAYV